ncbi:ABC transporter ATP-binding protein [Zavarzinia aquatilis]|uniref:ABC transporter ATP-binding protein n=1 Tax=Zavarzinia aquatilis TaxID=2211142 RepID=A0A317EE36_9PROT|nr:ABC transporter ATP-binding protein [Zavarzinia aquatilis]PWR25308.1 ABC transporter ATP-binding protein [Zavarzinia aquatilis]
MTLHRPVLRAVGLTKRFGSVVANDDVSLDVAAGELHCLFGENGAGKSTLSAMLHGELQPDAGHIEVDGRRTDFRSPADAIAEGIGMVHQHFVLARALTVIENIVAGTSRSGWRLGLTEARERLSRLCGDLGIAIELDAPLWQLSVGEQQWVEILKALYLDARVLILDEPTAVLTPQESGKLFGMIGKMRDRGLAVVIVTHKLREVLQADTITVLRRGRKVGTLDGRDATVESLTRLMIGGDLASSPARSSNSPGRVAVQATGLMAKGSWGETIVDDVSLMVRSGEIFGIAGVAGNGQKPLLEMLAGIREPESGSLLIGDRQLEGLSAADFMRAGVGIIPEDRYAEGLVGPFSIAENIILGRHRSKDLCRGLFIAGDRVVAKAEEAMRRYSIAAPAINTPVSRLSGGNAQKVVLARELDQASVLLLANQPTRGLDIGVVATVHEELRRKRDEGVAVILVSEDIDDLFDLCDRIGVMFAGRIVGIVSPETTSRDIVGSMMVGRAPAGGATCA